jgi:superfamily I DNA and/or RNA helicase
MPRDVSFLDRLAGLLELERDFQKREYAEAKKQLSLAQQEAQGLCVLDLEVMDDSVGLGGRFLLGLERFDRAALPMRLSPGDLIQILPRRAEKEEPAHGVVTRATHRRIEVALDSSPPPFVWEGRLRLDVVPNDATFSRARAALQRFQSMEGKDARRREVLLGNSSPQSEPARAFEATAALNPEQEDAVRCALAARDFFLVHGPPGTGKSTVLAEIAVQSAQAGERILATAASNAAVDHLLKLCLAQGLRAIRLGHPARVQPELMQHTLDIAVESHPDRKLSLALFNEAFEKLGYARRQRKQGRSRQRFAKAREHATEAHRMLDEARALERKAVRSVLDGAQVLCGTLASLDAGPWAAETFDLALHDEATQSIEPLSLIAFLKTPRVILAGDHRQLPPTVLSPDAASQGLSQSLFERLLLDHGEAHSRMLREQYRMHEEIASFPSTEMYGGQLRPHPSVASHTLAELLAKAVDAPPVLFLDTAGKGYEETHPEEGAKSFANEGEAMLIAARVRELLEAGLPAANLAVIAPYRAQVLLLRDLIEEPGLEIDTVDAFQGREKEAVLLGLTRSNAEGELGFLSDLRRMNVAITRARRHLFVVGDSGTLGRHPFYARFIEHAEAHGGYRSAWEWPGAVDPQSR